MEVGKKEFNSQIEDCKGEISRQLVTVKCTFGIYLDMNQRLVHAKRIILVKLEK